MDGDVRASRPGWVAPLARLAAVAVAYYVAGRLALLIAIPPGYATAVWPSAGIAFVATLRWGRSAAPGALLGSFAVNLATSLDTGSGAALAATAAIAVGAMLEALFGAALVRRAVGAHPALEDERAIARFLLLGGPVACLLGATWGTTALVAAGLVAPADAVFGWWTWWVGDTVGVLIFAPLLVALAGAPRARWTRGRRLAVAAPLVVGFALVTALFAQASAWERDRMAAELATRGAAAAHSIEQRAIRSIEVVESIAAFLEGAPVLSRERFARVVAGPLARNPALFGLGWNPRVAHADRAAFEAREVRIHDGRRDAPERAEYFPALYLEPAAIIGSAAGFDLSSEPARAAALDRARRSRATVATAPIALIQGGLGFLVAVPVFAQPGRAGELVGFAVGVYRAELLVATAIDGLPLDGLALALRDDTEAPSVPLHGAVEHPAWSRTLELVGRRWTLELGYATPGGAPRSWAAWVVLAGGLAFVGVLGAVLLIVTGRSGMLADAEQRYRDLYEHAPDMYVSVSASDGTMLECNATAARTLGRDRADMLGRPVFELYAPDSVPAARAAFAQFRETGVVQNVELQLVRADGTPLDVSLSATAVRDERGRVLRSRAVWRDISNLKQLDRDRAFLLALGEAVGLRTDGEAIMREATGRLVPYLSVLRCHFIEIDAVDDRLTVHQTDAAGVQGPTHVMPFEALHRSGLAEMLEGRHCAIADLEHDPRTAAAYVEVYAPRGGRAVLGLPLMRDRIAVASIVLISATIRAWTPREIELVQTVAERAWLHVEHVRMLAALRVSERHHRRIVESAGEGIWELDRELRTTFVNPRLASMLGYEPQQLIGRPLDELLDHARRDAPPEPGGRPARADEVPLLRRDGTPIWTRFASTPVIDEAGAVAGTLAMVADVTERVRAEEELRLLGRELEQRVEQRTRALAESEARALSALREKEVLLKELHHRVKNNLQVISSLLNLQAHRHDDPALRAAFAESRARVQSIAIVHDRLYRAKDLARVNLDEYLHALVEGLAAAHGGRDGAITTRIDASSVWLPVDAAIPCGLIVNELVTNAMKYAFPNGRRGTVAVTARHAAQERIEITVADDGVGLPAELDPRRSHSLGLDLVFTFAEQLRAEVEVRRGAGTAFVMAFRLADLYQPK